MFGAVLISGPRQVGKTTMLHTPPRECRLIGIRCACGSERLCVDSVLIVHQGNIKLFEWCDEFGEKTDLQSRVHRRTRHSATVLLENKSDKLREFEGRALNVGLISIEPDE